jgi:hypothetical protein
MAVFTVFLPPVPEGETPPPEKIVFLRDAFSWPAFVFGPLWLAWRRAFAAAAASLVALIALSIALSALQLPAGAGVWLGLAFGAWLGYEGVALVAWTLRRRGYVEADLVVADALDEAEEVFFARWRPSSAPPTEGGA